MRFLLLNQFYPPDPAPTGQYLHGLARVLVERGHQATVICSHRSYDGTKSFPPREILDGVEVRRLWATGFGRKGFIGKMADYLSFYLSLGLALTFDRSKPDLILSLTTPPYIGLLGKATAHKCGCRHAHWIMDLYPDVLFAHKMAREDGLAFRLLRKLTRFQFRGAKAVLSLGPQMAEKVAIYADSESRMMPVAGIPLWSDPELTPWPMNTTNLLRVERGWDANDVVFLYSGNMGLGHRFGEFLEAARQLGPSGPRWVFSGGGKRRREIETFAKTHPAARIEFLGYVPQDRLREHLGSADVHLASLDSAWQGLIVPSKVQASFAAARPVLFVGGRQCETAAWIQESAGGWIVDQDDLNGLLEAINQALASGERQRRGQAALKFAQKNFKMSENCTHIASLLEGGVENPFAAPAGNISTTFDTTLS
jgi:glycosyltransferase involved in cell wall biosynthesis